jgi:hypothetical protein
LRALRGEVGVEHPHDEDRRREQEQHLGGRVVEEELQRAAEMAVAIHRQRGDRSFGGRSQGLVHRPPQQHRHDQEQARIAGQASGALDRRQFDHAFTSYL